MTARQSRRLFVERSRIEASAGGPLALSAAEHHYLSHVLRLPSGAELEVFDGEGGAYPARVELHEGGGPAEELRVTGRCAEAALVLGPRREQLRSRSALQLLFALARGERCDLVVQKATELGVTRLTPFAATRSVVRLDRVRSAERVRRWERIAEEAARQCGRADVPAVDHPTSLAEALAALPPGTRLVVLYEGGGEPLAGLLDPNVPAHALAIGPEGGFTEGEIGLALEAGGHLATLGPRVLRFETAAIAAIAVAQHVLGELG